jgi:hypothetical protein
MEDDREEYELSEEFPAADRPNFNRKRQLSAVWRFYKRGAKDSNNKYSAVCLTPGCGFKVAQGKVHKLEAHVLVGCDGLSEEKRLEVKEALRRETLSRSGSLGQRGP